MSENGKMKVALVTGANKGIGFETARQLAGQGIAVLLGARDEGRGTSAAERLQAEGFNAQFLHLDVDDAKTHEGAARFIEENFGKLDILINNAAIAIDAMEGGRPVPASQTPLEVYRKTFETNFFNLIALTQNSCRSSEKAMRGASSICRASLAHSRCTAIRPALFTTIKYRLITSRRARSTLSPCISLTSCEIRRSRSTRHTPVMSRPI